MHQKYNACQSCGMPFKNDPKGGGTNSDGTKSTTYCSYCFHNGQFTQPDITVSQMQDFVKGKLKEMGLIHRLFAGFFVKGIPQLARWKKQEKR